MHDLDVDETNFRLYDDERLCAAVPIGILVREIHRDWWALLKKNDLLRLAVKTQGYAATRHALRGSTYRLVAELLSGERTSTDRPLTHCGPLPLPGPVGELSLIHI